MSYSYEEPFIKFSMFWIDELIMFYDFLEKKILNVKFSSKYLDNCIRYKKW